MPNPDDEQYFEESPDGFEFFINVSSQSYKEALEKRQSKKELEFAKLAPSTAERKRKEQTRNPAISDIGPYKLHITLDQESYTPELIKGIRQIIHKYPQAIQNYKYVDREQLETNLQWIKESQTVLQEMIDKPGSFTPTEKEAHFYQIYNSLPNTNMVLKKWQVHTQEGLNYLKRQLEEFHTEYKKSYDRFIHSDQFTLYIPVKHNEQALLQMSQELDEFLTTAAAKPGQTQQTECKAGKFINFRQELFQEDFQRLYNNPEEYSNRRISAGITDKKDIEKIQSEMQESKLYQNLFAKIEPQKALIKRLEEYITARKKEAGLNSDVINAQDNRLHSHYKTTFFGINIGFSAQEKILAVSHLLKILTDESNEPLTDKEVKILNNSHTKELLSRFKDIYDKVPKGSNDRPQI